MTSKLKRVFKRMIHPAMIAFYTVIMIICYLYFDRPIALYFYQMDLRQQLSWLAVVSLLGKWQIAVFPLLAAALYFHFFQPNSAWKNRFWFLFLCVFIPNVVGTILKILLGRARPDLWFSSQLYGFYGLKFHRPYWSFPSGHTITIASLASGLTILFPRYVYLFSIAALAVVSTRILLYHHYLSDVLSTLYLTIIAVGLMKCFLNKRKLLKL